MKFTEAQLEKAIIQLLGEQGYPHTHGESIRRDADDVLIREDLTSFLKDRHSVDGITDGEIDSILRRLDSMSAADSYESNKKVLKLISDGFLLKREDHKKKDLYIQLIDYSGLPLQRTPLEGEVEIVDGGKGKEPKAPYQTDRNRYRIVNQLEIVGSQKRIPDGILYINGIPLVVFEFKSAIREDATMHDAYVQLTTRYMRDIPELMKYNSLCVISDGANTKVGPMFAPYEFFYAWRKVTGNEEQAQEGISALHSMIEGLFNRDRLRQVIRHFVYFPDTSRRDEKIVCRYPQFYAATKLYQNILAHRKQEGDGKGGTYFGATGSGKSFTMLFLTRLLMKSLDFASPTIVLITDRTDLDDQLSQQFTNAKSYIGDQTVISVESRTELREKLKDRSSGGVFLTTIHKFTEDTKLLSERNNIICISDEAHRSQVNLDQKIRVTDQGVKRTYGFAKYLHDSLPNATYVGFTGTPIDATLDVFGEIVDAYTMTESVKDEITVRIVYEGRAAKVVLDNSKLEEIEQYYDKCEEDGANEYQIEASKKASASMSAILGDPDRLKALAADFVAHYEKRESEGATVKGKAMFVCSKREIAYDFWKEVVALRPQWNVAQASADGEELSEDDKKKVLPLERLKLVMTRGKDDPKQLYDMLGTSEDRKKLDTQFKNPKSNFKIAIVVDMWLTGFDVPELDSIYIDKPIQRHSLIQTISRVNRKFAGKNKGLVVDYIGIKKQMNLALAHYNKVDQQNVEEVATSINAVRDQLDVLRKMFHTFDASEYYTGEPLKQLNTLHRAVDFVQTTEAQEKRFMGIVKRLKAAYDICSGSELVVQAERDQVHFYLAVRSIVFKLDTRGGPDIAQMNKKVREMIAEALKSDGVEEIFKLDDDSISEVDLFDEEYLERISKIKLPNTKIKLLQKLLAKAIGDFKKTNRVQGIEFSKKLQALVDRYNDRKEDTKYVGDVFEDLTNELMGLMESIKSELNSHEELGIDLEEKAFYDILKLIRDRYEFEYSEEKLIELAKAIKVIVDEVASYEDWSKRESLKAQLKADIIVALAKHKYPPVTKDEVYKEVLEQAESYKKGRGGE